MKRRFIGNATSTPMVEMTTLKIISCHHGTMEPVTIMYAASPDTIGVTM